MQHVKLFEDFSSQETLSEDQINWLDRCTAGNWKLNPSTGLIDVINIFSFDCNQQDLTDFKGIRFGHINGGFYCDNNQITSLEGAPQTVGGGFYCTNNPVPEETLSSIFALMKKRKSYQQALEEHWPIMDDNDRALMYKDLKDLTPDEIRRYEALATVSRIKGYL